MQMGTVQGASDGATNPMAGKVLALEQPQVSVTLSEAEVEDMGLGNLQADDYIGPIHNLYFKPDVGREGTSLSTRSRARRWVPIVLASTTFAATGGEKRMERTAGGE